MPTQITQQESDGHMVLRVEGELLLEDAILLERITSEIRAETDKPVMIDLADLAFLDSESAAVLKRLAGDPQIELQGLEIFLQSAVDQAERTAL
jgi:anti-anti-sigma factor